MRTERQERRLAVAVSVGIHAAVFAALAAGGLFTFLQPHPAQAPVDVTVYNENAGPAHGMPAQAAGTGGSGGGTYAVPEQPLPAVNEAYTQQVHAAQEAVQRIMAQTGADETTARKMAAAQGHTHMPPEEALAASSGEASAAPGSGKGAALSGPAGGQSAPGDGSRPGNGGGSEAGSGGSGDGTGRAGSGEEGRRPAKSAVLLSAPDVDAYYPESLKRQHLGKIRVIVHIVVGTDGTVTSASVAESSGYPALDEAALQVAYQCRFSPAENEYGQPVTAEGSQGIIFKQIIQ